MDYGYINYRYVTTEGLPIVESIPVLYLTQVRNRRFQCSLGKRLRKLVSSDARKHSESMVVHKRPRFTHMPDKQYHGNGSDNNF